MADMNLPNVVDARDVDVERWPEALALTPADESPAR
jgi:hypothetical protein